MEAIVLRPGEGDALQVGPVRALLKATADTTSGAPVRFLNLNVPGGFEGYLRDLAAAISADGPPDPAALAKVFATHDVHPV